METYSRTSESLGQQNIFVAGFIKLCGKVSLLSESKQGGLILISELQQNLEKLHAEKHALGTEKTVEALKCAIKLLNEMCKFENKGYPNNNYNFYHSSPEASILFDTLYPKGTMTPEIKDDLMDEMCNEFVKTLTKFEPKDHLTWAVRTGYNIYVNKSGHDPIMSTKKALETAHKHYILIGRDDNLLLALGKIENKLSQLASLLKATPEHGPTKPLTDLYSEIMQMMHNAHLKFADNEQSPLRTVAKGVILPKLADCMEIMTQKFPQIPVEKIALAEPRLPPPMDAARFKELLIDYCQKLMADIERSPNKNCAALKFLNIDMKDRLRDIQSNKQPIADTSILLYSQILDAVRQPNNNKDSEAKSTDALLQSAHENIKAVMQNYTLDIARQAPDQTTKSTPKEDHSDLPTHSF